MTQIAIWTIKSSFTIRWDLFKKLNFFPNRSKIVNDALNIYFERNEYLKKAEEKFWEEKIWMWIKDVENGDIYSINPNGEKITKEILNKALNINPVN